MGTDTNMVGGFLHVFLLSLAVVTPTVAFSLPVDISKMAASGNALKQGLATMATVAVLSLTTDSAIAKMPEELAVGPEGAEVTALRQKIFSDESARTNRGDNGEDLQITVKEGSLALKKLPGGIRIPTRIPNSIGVTLPALGSVRADISVSVKTGASAADIANSDVVIALPKDLPKAAKLAAAGDASLSVDAPGLLSGRVDLDVLTPRKGEADVTVTSSLIPQLPLRKSAGTGRFCIDCGNGDELSEWFVARNLKNGVSFYVNTRTGASQFQVPNGF